MFKKLSLLFTLTTSFAVMPTARLAPWSITDTTKQFAGIDGGIPAFTNTYIVPTIDGTGATDVSATIQAALNAYPGQRVLISQEGYFKLAMPLTLRNNQVLSGVGTNTRLMNYAGTGDLIQSPSVDSNPYGSAGAFTPPWVISSGATKGSTNIVLVGSMSWMPTDGYIAILALPNNTNLNQSSIFSPSNASVRHGVGGQLDTITGWQQMVRILSISGNTITFTPCLTENFTNAPMAMAYWNSSINVGVEDLTISYVSPTGVPLDGGTAIHFNQVYNGWIKNVNVYNTSRRAFYIEKSVRGIITGCWISDHQNALSNGEQIDFARLDSSWLVYNNIGVHLFPALCLGDGLSSSTGYGICGNIIAYNDFSEGLAPSGIMGASVFANHGMNTMFNLFEGMIGDEFQADGYSGGSRANTLYRSYFSGVNTNASAVRHAYRLDRFNVDYNIGACVFGTNLITMFEPTNAATFGNWTIRRLGGPNIGNSAVEYYNQVDNPNWFFPGLRDYTGAQARFGPTTSGTTLDTNVPGDFSGVLSGQSIGIQNGSDTNSWKWVTTTSAGTFTNITITPAATVANGSYLYYENQNTWQALRWETATTLIDAGNYDYARGIISTDANWDEFPISLVDSWNSSTPPTWWIATNICAWPPVDPTRTPMVTMNPAMARRLNVNGSCTYSLNANSAVASYTGTIISGSLFVHITTGGACPWTAASNNSWLHILSGSSGLGIGVVNYSIDSTTVLRTGTLTVAGNTFTVTQQAPPVQGKVKGVGHNKTRGNVRIH